jgi:hypothetical protein
MPEIRQPKYLNFLRVLQLKHLLNCCFILYFHPTAKNFGLIPIIFILHISTCCSNQKPFHIDPLKPSGNEISQLSSQSVKLYFVYMFFMGFAVNSDHFLKQR